MRGREPSLLPQDKERLRRMLEDGLLVKDCARYLGCGEATVYRALKQMNQIKPVVFKNPRRARRHLFREQNARID